MSTTYLGLPDYRHGSPARCAVVLVNLGTPAAPTTSAVRRYLAEFLADPRVIELPRALWLPILYGAILPFRSSRSAHAYQQIWRPDGSPLRIHSEAIADGLQQHFDGSGVPVAVRLAMRYGQPSVASVLRGLQREGMRRLIVLPLYPQYSSTTTASVFDAVSAELGAWRWSPELRTITDYCREAGWLDAMADSIRMHWTHHPRGERLLFSFHGIPQRYVRSGDPYFCQCQFSAREIATRLELTPDQWQVSFQSRVGREEWLRPYTDETLRSLAASGLRDVDVVCPGFAADCLETLEEIAMQNAEGFRAAGGNALRYIPALNASPSHIDALARLVERHAQGWPDFDPAGRIVEQRRAEDSARRHAAFERG